MAGPPPVQPPKLTYKGRKEREEEEQEPEEELARSEPEVEEETPEAPAPRPEELPATSAPPGPPTLAFDREHEEATGPEEEPPEEPLFEGEEPPAPPVPSPMVAMEEAPIEMLAHEVEEEEEEEEEVEEEVKPRPPPPRPPKSPDMRPVHVGFILVGVGLLQGLYGLWAMLRAHTVGSGNLEQVIEWAYFAQAFTAAFLGTVCLRDALWSFRKERYDTVMLGAIAGSMCVWALWVPWLFALLALTIVHKAKEEYYPHYEPARDAPSWARPPPRPAPEVEEALAEVPEGEEEALDGKDPSAADGAVSGSL